MLGEASPRMGFDEIEFNYDAIPQTAATVKQNDVIVVSNLLPMKLSIKTCLTPFEALEVVIKNAGLGVTRKRLDGNFSTVQEGQRGDLILL